MCPKAAVSYFAGRENLSIVCSVSPGNEQEAEEKQWETE